MRHEAAIFFADGQHRPSLPALRHRCARIRNCIGGSRRSSSQDGMNGLNPTGLRFECAFGLPLLPMFFGGDWLSLEGSGEFGADAVKSCSPFVAGRGKSGNLIFDGPNHLFGGALPAAQVVHSGGHRV